MDPHLRSKGWALAARALTGNDDQEALNERGHPRFYREIFDAFTARKVRQRRCRECRLTIRARENHFSLARALMLCLVSL